MRSSVIGIGDRDRAGAERDAALVRMGRARRVLAIGSLGLAAAFTVMADGATPAFNKQRGAAAHGADSVAPRSSSASPAPARHPRRKHRSSSASAAPSTAAPSAPAPAPAAPPAAPAPTQQAPAVTSGGS